MMKLTKKDQELLERVRKCRPADLADGLDAIGLINTGTMNAEMRPIRPNILFAGYAYTVKLIPGQDDVKVCKDTIEYHEELDKWCGDTYKFWKPIGEGECKDMVVVIDEGGYPGGVWGSMNGLESMILGLSGAVIDGSCRDSYECNIEKVPAFCTKRTFNHVYGRLVDGGTNIPVQCAGVTVNPGDMIVADDDGVLVIPYDKLQIVVEIAEDVHRRDQKARKALYARYGLEPDETLI